jgi:membrane carboxypeptidase/penicillin-binding protein
MTLRDALVHSKNVITVDLALQLNIGRVMNLAAKAGMPKVDKAYPSMALGTAEATPLSVAEAYTTFANLGDRVAPLPITKIASGDGRTVNAPTVDRKNVVRPDVAYIMDDMMKDVINRGTAAQAGAWGFKNVPGQRAYAGKTGTSRDGWFAGFTPELVCVVYVGFDDGSDLDMKGADSAMPIWADFMQKALGVHPEWNGDWAIPPNVRKAEIDTRTGALIRELDTATADASTPATPTPTAYKPSDPALAQYYQADPTPTPDIYNTNVPTEFRRTELFIAGTLPMRSFSNPDDAAQNGKPTPSPTPINETWQDAEPSGGQPVPRPSSSPTQRQRKPTPTPETEPPPEP